MKINIKIPKKYQKYFGSLDQEYGLCDEFKYMLYYADGYCYADGYKSIPIKSKKEALEFLKKAQKDIYNY